LNQKDYRELYLLRERFGVEPPTALLDDVMAGTVVISDHGIARSVQ
jgi:hypothetical protein